MNANSMTKPSNASSKTRTPWPRPASGISLSRGKNCGKKAMDSQSEQCGTDRCTADREDRQRSHEVPLTAQGAQYDLSKVQFCFAVTDRRGTLLPHRDSLARCDCPGRRRSLSL